MSWPEDFHPEVGYLLPSQRTRRLIRFVSLAAGFGLLVGVCGTLALLAPHGEEPNPIINKPTSPFVAAEQSVSQDAGSTTALASGPVPTDDAGTSDSPVAERRFWTRRLRALCLNPPSATNQACSFRRKFHVAKAPEPSASPTINSTSNKGVDDTTQRPKRPQKYMVTQTRRQRPAVEPSDYPRDYASSIRYGERAYFDRGGFW
jgi:hypothetical protein